MAPDLSRNVIGEKLRKARVSCGISQAGLAAKLQIQGWDLDRIGLSKIERGERTVSDAELFLLGNVLGVSVEEFAPSKSRLRDFLEQQRSFGRTKSRSGRS